MSSRRTDEEIKEKYEEIQKYYDEIKKSDDTVSWFVTVQKNDHEFSHEMKYEQKDSAPSYTEPEGLFLSPDLLDNESSKFNWISWVLDEKFHLDDLYNPFRTNIHAYAIDKKNFVTISNEYFIYKRNPRHYCGGNMEGEFVWGGEEENLFILEINSYNSIEQFMKFFTTDMGKTINWKKFSFYFSGIFLNLNSIISSDKSGYKSLGIFRDWDVSQLVLFNTYSVRKYKKIYDYGKMTNSVIISHRLAHHNYLDNISKFYIKFLHELEIDDYLRIDNYDKYYKDPFFQIFLEKIEFLKNDYKSKNNEKYKQLWEAKKKEMNAIKEIANSAAATDSAGAGSDAGAGASSSDFFTIDSLKKLEIHMFTTVGYEVWKIKIIYDLFSQEPEKIPDLKKSLELSDQEYWKLNLYVNIYLIQFLIRYERIKSNIIDYLFLEYIMKKKGIKDFMNLTYTRDDKNEWLSTEYYTSISEVINSKIVMELLDKEKQFFRLLRITNIKKTDTHTGPDSFMNKYLKYKNKYLQLKRNLTKNKF